MLRKIAKHLPDWCYSSKHGVLRHKTGAMIDIMHNSVDILTGEARFREMTDDSHVSEHFASVKVLDSTPQQIARRLKSFCNAAVKRAQQRAAEEAAIAAKAAVRGQYLQQFRRDHFDEVDHYNEGDSSSVTWDYEASGNRHRRVRFEVNQTGRRYDVTARNITRIQALAIARVMR